VDAVKARRGFPPFQALIEEHRGLVYRFLVASVGPVEADDCFQETFLAALRTYPNLRHGENLRAWLMAIAASKAADAGRRTARRPVPVAEPEPAAGAGVGAARHDEPAVPDPNDPLWRAVRALSDRQRTAVVLRTVLDRPYGEVAMVMGSSEETARAHVSQGLASLRRTLKDAEVER
jgi:RNA polymerase sigma factor (sigma-70 family)